MLQALASEQWDVIFSDYSLPKFNGIAALEIYREKGSISLSSSSPAPLARELP
jgi:CheY-like chemotaxis protein